MSGKSSAKKAGSNLTPVICSRQPTAGAAIARKISGKKCRKKSNNVTFRVEHTRGWLRNANEILVLLLAILKTGRKIIQCLVIIRVS